LHDNLPITLAAAYTAKDKSSYLSASLYEIDPPDLIIDPGTFLFSSSPSFTFCIIRFINPLSIGIRTARRLGVSF
jgi:hypothetical protein